MSNRCAVFLRAVMVLQIFVDFVVYVCVCRGRFDSICRVVSCVYICMYACTIIVAWPSMCACDVVRLMEAFVLICGAKNVPLPSV